MQIERFTFSGYDGLELPATLWLPKGDPIAVLQVTHGMTEYIERSAALAEALTEKGIAVAGFDLRGHGRNPGDMFVASLGAGGWDLSIEDMHLFFTELKLPKKSITNKNSLRNKISRFYIYTIYNKS